MSSTRTATAFLHRLAPTWPVWGALAVITGVVGLVPWLAGPALVTLALALVASAGVALWRRRGRDRSPGAIEALLGADPDPVWLTDADGAVLGINPAGRGVGADPALALAGVSADPVAVVLALRRQALRYGTGERAFAHPQTAVRLNVHQVQGPAGAERPDLLWRLSRGAAAPRRGLDHLSAPVLSVDAAGQPLLANAALRSALGGDDPAALLSALTPLLNGQAPVVAVGLPGGATCHAIALRAEDGVRDIVLLPSWLRAEGAAPTRDFEDVPVALALIAADGRILDSNHLARALLGIGPGEARHLWEIVEGLGRPVADWLADGRAGRALNRPEVMRATLPRNEAFVQIILRRPPAAPPGPLETMIAVLSDATELKSLEGRFVQSQKMQAIGQLAGGVAHDFNNLLTAISGHCDLLLLERDGFDPDFNDLQQIRQNTNRAAALVRQLLAFSRKQTLKPEVVVLESLLENLTHLLTRLVGGRISLDLRHDPDLWPVRADPRQLEQVILNLVVNARDAMPMGGTIRIDTQSLTLASDLERGRVRVPAGRYSVIRVTDAGLGIPAEIIDKIFEPFFTTKRPGEGTGLGLSTAYGIVKQMGGWIFVDSREGSGSTFTLYFSALDAPLEARPSPSALVAPPRPGLPVATPAGRAEAPAATRDADRAAQQHADAVQAGTPGPGAGLYAADAASALDVTGDDAAVRPAAGRPAASAAPARIAAGSTAKAEGAPSGAPLQGVIVLLVEDEAPVRMFAARALRLQGCHVLEAETGEQALDYLTDPTLRVDLFLSDVVMPGLDGPGWVSRAVSARPQTPVIFMSGYAEDALTAALARVPRSTFLSKPFSLRELIVAVQERTDQTGLRRA